MLKTKAAFRAMRETCGYSQQDVADEADVRVLTVKKWESPSSDIKQPPDDVWQWLLSERQRQEETAHDLAEQAIAMAEQEDCGGHIVIAYYRSQEELDACQLPAGRDEAVGWVNASSRLAADIIEQAGYEVRFAYRAEG